MTERGGEARFKGEPMVKIFLLLLSFLKCIHFVVVFEEFGFFVKMVTCCVADLAPFFLGFFLFLNVFATLNSVMNVEPDPELETPGTRESLGYFGLMLLEVLRNSMNYCDD